MNGILSLGVRGCQGGAGALTPSFAFAILRGMSRIAALAVAVCVAAAGLSAKAAYDLLQRRASFPDWFVPVFVAGLAALVGYSLFVTFRIWRRRQPAVPVDARLSIVVWILLPLSFPCTAAVHQFYPFRPSLLTVLGELDVVLRFNLALTGFGFLAAVVLAGLYLAGPREAAVLGVLVLALVLLVPNDACANPFNEWWIATLGASPLMFVPNLFASLFAVAVLQGIDPRWNAAALGATCLGVLLLGLGHMTRVIW